MELGKVSVMVIEVGSPHGTDGIMNGTYVQGYFKRYYVSIW